MGGLRQRSISSKKAEVVAISAFFIFIGLQDMLGRASLGHCPEDRATRNEQRLEQRARQVEA